ncbi:MAG TPA: DUF2092 domain-containing protein [Candidatus Competibacteraceae bacterium]|nr:DUF2092 domain-containing protein [Candidatus Competibacteraceae bacterium]
MRHRLLRSLLLSAGLLLLGYADLSLGQQLPPEKPPTPAPAENPPAPAIESQAERILREMGDYLKARERFTFRVNYSYEILPYDQKLEFSATAEVAVDKPNKLWIDANGDILQKRFWYDGKTLTVLNVERNQYASTAVSGNLDKMFEYANTDLGIVLPAADFAAQDPYAALSKDVKSGYYIGLYDVDGVNCHHLAFSQSKVDWQLWIEAGEKPLPKKLVITYKGIPGVPEYRAIYSHWNFEPKFREGQFTFTPPEKAVKIDFMPATPAKSASETVSPASAAPAPAAAPPTPSTPAPAKSQ